MAIFNSDGSAFQPTGSLQQFDPGSSEIALFNSLDQEIIEIGGSPLFYYEVFIQSNTVDPIYWEDRGKLWSNVPVTLYGYYEPITSQNFLGQFGIDSPDEMVFELNYRGVLNILGHPPKIGSRIFTPHKKENWVIIQRDLADFKLWGEFRLQLVCQRFQESSSDASGSSRQQNTDFTIN